ncbi:MAG: HaeII family restriction endonuclease [Bacillota bacterium]
MIEGCTTNGENFCKSNIKRMLKNSQTKVIFPVITLALLKEHHATGKLIFSDQEIRKAYEQTVKDLKDFLKHDVHIGGKYYDAYPSRNLPRYAVVKSVGHMQYQLLSPYTDHAASLCEWIPERIKEHISSRLGIIPFLDDPKERASLAANPTQFLSLINEHMNKTPSNFEIFSFAIIKVHLEKFACKIYRDTRTAAYDGGVDLSTNFGVVYQIKKLKILTEAAAKNIYEELKMNFDTERLQSGNVILIIDDISKAVKQYLISMKVQSLSKDDVLRLAAQFEDMEDRQKVLRIVYEEFRREYSSRIR